MKYKELRVWQFFCVVFCLLERLMCKHNLSKDEYIGCNAGISKTIKFVKKVE